MRAWPPLSLSLLLLLAGPSFAQQPDTVQPQDPSAQAASSNMPDVIGATPDSQSYPSKYSKKNDRLDKLPVMGHPISLTDQQKRRIVEAVKQQNKPVETIAARPAELVPDSVTAQPLPDGLAQEIPILDHLKYVRIPGKVLLVIPSNKIVVGEVTE